jgi:tetratricopeptide (TPR) repeat protein
LADFYLRRGEIDAAAPFLAAAERLVCETNIRFRLTEIHRYWAQVHLARSQLQAALEDVEQSLRVARELGNASEEGLGIRVQGQILIAAGQITEALAAFEQSLILLASDPYETARTKVQLGRVRRDGRDVEVGTRLLQEAQATLARLGARRDLAEAEQLLA